MIIHPNVTIYPNSKIGDNSILHSGVVIGADGFGFAPKEDGSYAKVPQTGNVIIEDDCWFGAYVVINKGSFIKKGSVVGALSLITKSTDEYSINVGIPTKKIGERKS